MAPLAPTSSAAKRLKTGNGELLPPPEETPDALSPESPAAKRLKTGDEELLVAAAAAKGKPSPAKSQPLVAGSPMGARKAPVPPRRNAPSSEWAQHYHALAVLVTCGLPGALKKAGVNLEEYGELHQVPPTDIEHNSKPAIGGSQMATHKERWNVARCLKSLETTGKYEAPGSFWWFNLLVGGAIWFKHQKIIDVEPDRASVEAAATLFDDTAFRASDLTEENRHFDFPGAFPSAVPFLGDATTRLQYDKYPDTPSFHKLPLLAGRPVALAFLEAIAACITSTSANDQLRLRKLFEARGFC